PVIPGPMPTGPRFARTRWHRPGMTKSLAMTTLSAIDQRPDAAGESQNPRTAFALDLLGGKAKRGDAAIHGKAVARGGAVKRRRDAKNFPPPFAQRNRKAAFPPQLDVGQGARLHVF